MGVGGGETTIIKIGGEEPLNSKEREDRDEIGEWGAPSSPHHVRKKTKRE